MNFAINQDNFKYNLTLKINEKSGLCRIYTSCLVFSLKPKILDIMLPLTF